MASSGSAIVDNNMGGLFNYDSKLIQTLNKFADMMIVSLLWIVSSITIIGFGPACVAAYHAMTKSVRYDRGRLFKEYVAAFKSGFFKSLMLGLLVLLFFVSLYFYDLPQNVELIQTGLNPNIPALIALICKSVFMLALVVYIFPIQSRFQMPLMWILTASVLLMFRHFGKTVMMIAWLLVVLLVKVSYPYFLIVSPGAFFYGLSFIMERIMRAHMTEEEKQDDGKDRWYLDD